MFGWTWPGAREPVQRARRYACSKAFDKGSITCRARVGKRSCLGWSVSGLGVSKPPPPPPPPPPATSPAFDAAAAEARGAPAAERGRGGGVEISGSSLPSP